MSRRRRWRTRADRERDDESEAPAAQTDIEALRTTREESRTVLDHQLSVSSDIDDKAMHTVRTAVLLLGLVLSAISLAPDVVLNDPATAVVVTAGFGLVLLFVCVVVGIGTYASSTLRYGVATSHREDVVAGGYTEREWLFFLLNEYDEWTSEMRALNTRNEVLLSFTLSLLVVSLGLLGASVVLMVLLS